MIIEKLDVIKMLMQLLEVGKKMTCQIFFLNSDCDMKGLRVDGLWREFEKASLTVRVFNAEFWEQLKK